MRQQPETFEKLYAIFHVNEEQRPKQNDVLLVV